MVDRIYRSLLNNFYPTDIQQIIPFIGFKIVGTDYMSGCFLIQPNQ